MSEFTKPSLHESGAEYYKHWSDKCTFEVYYTLEIRYLKTSEAYH